MHFLVSLFCYHVSKDYTDFRGLNFLRWSRHILKECFYGLWGVGLNVMKEGLVIL